MATINLGRVKPVFRGAYAGGTAYVVDDIVTYSNETYICILASTGNLPTDTTYWTKLAAKGVDGTDLTSTLTTQGDIVYRNASGLARLGAGTAGQVLQTGGAGANPSWVDSSGGLIQKTYFETTTNTSTTSTSYVATSLVNSITPTSASNKIWISGMIGGCWQNGGGSLHLSIYRQINGGGYSEWRRLEGGYFLYASGTGGAHSINLYDTTHNSTNQVDYKLYMKSEAGDACIVGGSSAYQTMSLIEIGV